ncbi:hypothetical protein MPDQ_006467 [Monascus purpureus]|uniref:Zn(2)-C6 fungal-type domain-containing protein n=1 Tax=Monascus purpureus TaxID=5098 RepID=A0A507QY69_MONPU|nr:hypothetical protein MPDQ_006467 [Monascus purpureus]BDD63704.1 hypothetical protein MAP00_008570 [Monascus purpureus]
MSSSLRTHAGGDASPPGPLTQEPKDEQNKKPPKIRSTCDACQAAKLRCSRGNPCFRCLHYGTACRYSPSKPVGRPRRTAGSGLRDGEKATTEEKKANRTGSRRKCQEDRCSTASALSPGHSDLSSGAATVAAPETVLRPLSLPDATESWMAGDFTAHIGNGEGSSRSRCPLPAGLSFSDTTKEPGEVDWNPPHATTHGAVPASFFAGTTADPARPPSPAYIPSNMMPADYRTSPGRRTCLLESNGVPSVLHRRQGDILRGGPRAWETASAQAAGFAPVYLPGTSAISVTGTMAGYVGYGDWSCHGNASARTYCDREAGALGGQGFLAFITAPALVVEMHTWILC